MDGSRILDVKRNSPTIYLTTKDFPFVRYMLIEDKGSFGFNGVIDSERIDSYSEDETSIIKSIKITALTNDEKARVTR